MKRFFIRLLKIIGVSFLLNLYIKRNTEEERLNVLKLKLFFENFVGSL